MPTCPCYAAPTVGDVDASTADRVEFPIATDPTAAAVLRIAVSFAIAVFVVNLTALRGTARIIQELYWWRLMLLHQASRLAS